jgi:hypothetical protein
MNRNKRTIFLVVSILREAIIPIVAYEDTFDAQRKAAELDENRLAGDKTQYIVHSIELVEEK